MSKPVRLYPKSEPMAIDPRFMFIGCGATGLLFFVLGWTFQNISMVAWGGCHYGTRYVSLRC